MGSWQVQLVINDRIDVALAVGADGVHVGQGDIPASQARQLLGPNRILGVSVKTVEQAQKAERDGADYLGAGASKRFTYLEWLPLSSTLYDSRHLIAGSAMSHCVWNELKPMPCSVCRLHTTVLSNPSMPPKGFEWVVSAVFTHSTACA